MEVVDINGYLTHEYEPESKTPRFMNKTSHICNKIYTDHVLHILFDHILHVSVLIVITLYISIIYISFSFAKPSD